MRKSPSARNSLWIITERLFSVGIGTLIIVLSARYLGADNFGIISYGLSIVALFAGVMKLGLDYIIVNEIISNRKKEESFIATSLYLRLLSSFLSIAAILILALLLNGSEPTIVYVALVQSVVLVFQSFNILDYWFQSSLKSKYVSLAKITAAIVGAMYSIYILLSAKDVIWFAVSTVIVSAVTAVVLCVFYKAQSNNKLATLSLRDAKYLLAKSQHFIVASIIVVIYIQVDKIMIANMLGNAEVGLYAAALALCTAWVFLPESIITSLRPGIVEAKNLSQALYLRKLRRLYFLVFWVSFVFSALITIFAPMLIILLFGESYKESILVLQIAVWYIPFSMLNTARNVWVVTEEKHRFTKYYLSWGLVMNIGLNLILIPKIGIVGAALATVITEVVTCFLAPLFYKATREHPRIVIEGILFNLKNNKKGN